MKVCTKCREAKAVSEFSPDRRQSSGLQGQCKACRRAQMKKWHAKPEIREYWTARARAARRADPRPALLQDAKKRARIRGVPYDLKPTDFIIPELCPVLGCRLVVGGLRDHAPSLDAIIPSHGYTRGNVQIISTLANRMKNSATPEELAAFARWVLSESTEASSGQRCQLKAVA